MHSRSPLTQFIINGTKADFNKQLGLAHLHLYLVASTSVGCNTLRVHLEALNQLKMINLIIVDTFPSGFLHPAPKCCLSQVPLSPSSAS